MKTTKQDFEKYKGFCEYWLRELGLTHWHVYYAHKKLDDCYARTSYQVSSGTATIEFNTSWDEYRAINDEELKSNALHEVLHLVTAPLLVEGEDRFSTQFNIDREEHAIVVRLTNYITRITK
jgi:hypothetical protein